LRRLDIKRLEVVGLSDISSEASLGSRGKMPTSVGRMR
jgi:hypothetical protein